MTYTIVIFTQKTLKTSYKRFANEASANAYYEKRMSKVQPIVEPRENCFEYRTNKGNLIHVQKMWIKSF